MQDWIYASSADASSNCQMSIVETSGNYVARRCDVYRRVKNISAVIEELLSPAVAKNFQVGTAHALVNSGAHYGNF